jgi:hypothetical protein
MNRPMFPNTVDSTMLSTFRSCPQKMLLTYVQHWKPKSESVHLVAGGAFAKGVEVGRKAFFEGTAVRPQVDHVVINGELVHQIKWHEEPCEAGNQNLAQELGVAALLATYGDFDPPPDSAKSAMRMAGALEFYFAMYPFGEDGAIPLTFPNGRRGIEFSFAEPTEVLHPVTGNPILYTGRADMLAEFNSGNYVFDEKTASQLGASWPNQWEMRSQFSGYIWAAQRAGLNCNGAVVRGVSILKTKYDHMQALTYRTPYEIERWYGQVNRDLRRMIQCWEEGYWDWNLDHACAEYGGCIFSRQVCKSANPEVWLETHFEQRVWDPLMRKQLTVPEYEASWGHNPDGVS